MRGQMKVRLRERRPTTPRGAATRARIVEAAADLVLARGAIGTSLEDIMEASSTSKSQLYHYFADKDALMRAVIECQTGRVMGFQAARLQGVDSLAGLRRWRDAIVRINKAAGGVGGCPLGSLASELADRSESARALLAHGFELWESLSGDGSSGDARQRQAQARGEPGRSRRRDDRGAPRRPPPGPDDTLEPAARTRARHGDRPHRPFVPLRRA